MKHKGHYNREGFYEHGIKGFSEKELVRISKLSNRELYEELLNLAGGDDYDGCLTPKGEITFELLKKEFEGRLPQWLKK